MKKLLLICLLISFTSCTDKSKESNKLVSNKNTTYVDSPFVQEYHEGFLIDKNNNNANDVRAIQPDNNNHIWIATKDGVYRKESENSLWNLMILGSDQGPAYDVSVDKNNNIWVATWNGVYTNKSGKLEKSEGPKPPIAKVVGANEGVYALGPHGVWLFKNDTWEKKNYKLARSIRGVISDNNEGLWVGTDVGLYHCNDSETKIYKKNKIY